MKLTQVEWVPVAKAVAKEYGNVDVPGLAAEMAYHFIFALFPFVIFLATMAGIVGRAISQGRLVDDIMSTFFGQLPPAAADALRQPLEDVLGQRGGQALSLGAAVGLVLTLYSASNGVATVMKACNRAYGVRETRRFITQKALAVGLTLVMSLLLIVGFVLLAFGGDLIRFADSVIGLQGFTQTVLDALRIVAALAGISLALALLYWLGPNVEQHFRWLTPGSVLATLAFVVLSIGFGFYVNLIGASSYAKTYGTAFGLVLFLYFLNLASQVIVLGAVVNAETAKRRDPKTIRDKGPAEASPPPQARLTPS